MATKVGAYDCRLCDSLEEQLARSECDRDEALHQVSIEREQRIRAQGLAIDIGEKLALITKERDEQITLVREARDLLQTLANVCEVLRSNKNHHYADAIESRYRDLFAGLGKVKTMGCPCLNGCKSPDCTNL